VRGWAADLFDGDDALLIEQIQTRLLVRRGVFVSPDEILVTVGAQHALFMLGTLLVDAGTTVGIENPGYPDARNIFAARTSNVVPLPLDGSGLALSPALDRCDYVYLTPSHQCPTNVTMPLARREALLAWAQANDRVLIEDDLRDRARIRGARASGAAKPRPERSRDLRQQPVEDAGAGNPHRLHRRQPRPDPRAPRAAPADAASSGGEQRALGRPCSSRWAITMRCCAGCGRRTPERSQADGGGAVRASAARDVHDRRRRVVVLAALSRRTSTRGRSRARRASSAC
jgi:hypothetical protein